MNYRFQRPDGTFGEKLMFHDDDGNPYDEILTKQSFVEECDINTIIRRYHKSGVLPQATVNGAYGDFSQVNSFQDAMVKICEAQEFFDSLPAEMRYRFQNDPGKFIDFIDDPANKTELIKMGLVSVDQEPVAQVVEPEVPSVEG